MTCGAVASPLSLGTPPHPHRHPIYFFFFVLFFLIPTPSSESDPRPISGPNTSPLFPALRISYACPHHFPDPCVNPQTTICIGNSKANPENPKLRQMSPDVFLANPRHFLPHFPHPPHSLTCYYRETGLRFIIFFSSKKLYRIWRIKIRGRRLVDVTFGFFFSSNSFFPPPFPRYICPTRDIASLSVSLSHSLDPQPPREGDPQPQYSKSAPWTSMDEMVAVIRCQSP